jgi:hypothetical protein
MFSYYMPDIFAALAVVAILMHVVTLIDKKQNSIILFEILYMIFQIIFLATVGMGALISITNLISIENNLTSCVLFILLLPVSIWLVLCIEKKKWSMYILSSVIFTIMLVVSILTF